jgi:hypothetical protein
LRAAALIEGAAAFFASSTQRALVFDKAVWANYPDLRHPFEVEREVKL